MICHSWYSTKSNLNRHFKHCHSTGNDKSKNEKVEHLNDTRPSAPETAELNYYNDHNSHGLITQILNSYEELVGEYNKLCETLKHNKRCTPKEKSSKRQNTESGGEEYEDATLRNHKRKKPLKHSAQKYDWINY